MEKMVRYVVVDDFGEVAGFTSYESAVEYMQRYITETLPYLAKIGESMGVTQVRIEKETYEIVKDNMFKFIDRETVFTSHIV